jgi:alanyl-tRNA synthetase
MQTQALYYAHPSTDTLSAVIRELRPQAGNHRSAIILDKTIFYPEGGGQPGDRGTINGIPLIDVREQDGEILHLVSAEDGKRLAAGPAELRLDAARRRDFTVCHTGQHLLSGTILRLTGAYTVSMHLGDETCTIDVDTPALGDDTLAAVEDAVMDGIEENHAVVIHLCPPEDVNRFPLRKTPPQGEAVIRVVEIEGCDFSPCCGTHVNSTGALGILRILGAEKYKGMTRITFIVGRRCHRESRMLRANADIISRALKTPVPDIGRSVLDHLEKAAATERRLKAREEAAAAQHAEALAAACAGLETGALVIQRYNADTDEVLRIGRAAQKLTSAVLLLASETDHTFAALCGAPSVDIRPLIKAPFEASSGRGGGGPTFFQGAYPDKASLDKFLSGLTVSS